MPMMRVQNGKIQYPLTYSLPEQYYVRASIQGNFGTVRPFRRALQRVGVGYYAPTSTWTLLSERVHYYG
jgi:hypothetical protein